MNARPIHTRPGGTLLRFWQVDYKCDVWLNDSPIGSHEGGESMFVFDVTKFIKPGQVNRLAVRVLNPTHDPIDGIVLNETRTPQQGASLPIGQRLESGRDLGLGRDLARTSGLGGGSLCPA